MSEDEEWVKVAMSDDTMVAELLLKLKRAEPQTLNMGGDAPALRLDWSVRQRRSKKKQLVMTMKKKAEPARASPTTPLSWSAATSVSGGVSGSGSGSGGGGGAADVFEEKPIDTARSKVAVTSETPTTKRSRRKKTLAQLKEEESLLLKERRDLKNQLENLRLTVEKQRAANESLKRIKLDLQSRQISETVTASIKSEVVNSDQLQLVKVGSDPTCSILPISASCNKLEQSPPNACLHKPGVGGREPSFLLPDLNLPVEVEDDSGSKALYGIS